MAGPQLHDSDHSDTVNTQSYHPSIQKYLNHLKKRQKKGLFWSALAGFIDRSFDVAAIYSILSAIGITVLTLVLGGLTGGLFFVIALALYFGIGLTFVGGIFGAFQAVSQETEEQREEIEEINKLQKLLETKKEFLKDENDFNLKNLSEDDWETQIQNKVREIVAKETGKKDKELDKILFQAKIPQALKKDVPIENAKPPKTFVDFFWHFWNKYTFTGPTAHKLDIWSRRGRNATNLSIFLVEFISFLSFFLVNGLVFALNALSLIVIIPLTAVQFGIWWSKQKFVEEPRKENKQNIKNTEDEIKKEINFYLEVKNRVNQAISVSLGNPVVILENQSQAEVELQKPKKNNTPNPKKGRILAVILGFCHGALHPIAWAAIALFVMLFFWTPPVLFLLVGVGITAALAMIFGAVNARREYVIESKKQEEETVHEDQARIAREEFSNQYKKSLSLEPNINIDNMHNKNIAKINALQIDSKAKENYITQLNAQKDILVTNPNPGIFSTEKLKKIETINTELKNKYNPTQDEKTPDAKKEDQPPLERRARDFWSLFEKTISSADVSDVIAMCGTLGLWVIVMVVSEYKNSKIDIPRNDKTKLYKQTINDYEAGTRDIKNNENVYTSQINKHIKDHYKEKAEQVIIKASEEETSQKSMEINNQIIEPMPIGALSSTITTSFAQHPSTKPHIPFQI